MHIEFLVEEASVEAVLRNIVPQILGDVATYNIHPHQGKQDLLRKLPNRLKAYKKWIPENYYIVVLVDADEEDCRKLKAQLEAAARDAGFTTKSAAPNAGRFQVVSRIAMKELEAWFFGDVEAICAAYPRVSRTLARRKSYRDPDAVVGGTWEALQRELQRAGYHPGGLNKIAAAMDISRHMRPDRNRSRSFQVFCEGLRAMCAQETPQGP